MGYEVLDSGGRATDLPDDPRPPRVDVLDLDDATRADERPAPWAPRARRWLAATAATVSSAVVATGRAVAAAPLTARRTLAVVTGSLLVGGLVGAVVVHSRDDAAAVRADRAVLAVDASEVDVNIDASSPDKVSIQTTARVTNHGPRPIRVVTGTTPAGLVVAAIGTTTTTVPGGGRGLVKATLVVDCHTTAPVPVPLVRVRTADGRRHDVRLEIGAFGGTPVREAVCQGSQSQSVEVSLSGSLERPVLQLANRSAHDQKVTVNGLLITDADNKPLVTTTTSPAGPLVVRAGARRDVRVTVRAVRCVREVATLSGAGYLAIDVVPADGGVQQSGQGVDLSPLVGAAVARACSR